MESEASGLSLVAPKIQSILSGYLAQTMVLFRDSTMAYKPSK